MGQLGVEISSDKEMILLNKGKTIVMAATAISSRKHRIIQTMTIMATMTIPSIKISAGITIMMEVIILVEDSILGHLETMAMPLMARMIMLLPKFISTLIRTSDIEIYLMLFITD